MFPWFLELWPAGCESPKCKKSWTTFIKPKFFKVFMVSGTIHCLKVPGLSRSIGQWSGVPCIHMYIYVFMYVCMYVCMYVYIYRYTRYICIYICKYMCMYIYVHVYVNLSQKPEGWKITILLEQKNASM